MHERLSLHRPSIPRISDARERPLWSVMIPVYNCAFYLREALAGVLAQDPGRAAMQIEVVDDHSTEDDPAAVVQELGGGRVAFHRQRRNVGYVRNFETCLRRARGGLVHLLHGDDGVREGFYRRMQQPFEAHPEIGAAFCRHIYVDEDGHWESLSPLERRSPGVLDDWLTKIAGGQRLATPAVVVRREVYEELGGFDRRFTRAGEDWEMWVRIAAHYPVWFEPEPLAIYRVKRAGSLTGASDGTLELVEDMLRAAEIIDTYLSEHLPAQEARALLRKARQTYAGWALEPVAQTLARGDAAAAFAQIRQAQRCSRSFETARAVTTCLSQAGWRWGRSKVRTGMRRLRGASGKNLQRDRGGRRE
jgi:hypothetical protein